MWVRISLYARPYRRHSIHPSRDTIPIVAAANTRALSTTPSNQTCVNQLGRTCCAHGGSETASKKTNKMKRNRSTAKERQPRLELHRTTLFFSVSSSSSRFSPVPVRLDEGEVGQQAIVRAAPDREGVMPAVGVENVKCAAKAHGLRRAEAQLDGDALRSRAELRSVTRYSGQKETEGGGGGGVEVGGSTRKRR